MTDTSTAVFANAMPVVGHTRFDPRSLKPDQRSIILDWYDDTKQFQYAHRNPRRWTNGPDIQPSCTREGRIRRRRKAAVFNEDSARESSAPRGQRVRQGPRYRGACAVGSHSKRRE